MDLFNVSRLSTDENILYHKRFYLKIYRTLVTSYMYIDDETAHEVHEYATR